MGDIKHQPSINGAHPLAIALAAKVWVAGGRRTPLSFFFLSFFVFGGPSGPLFYGRGASEPALGALGAAARRATDAIA